MELFLTGYSLLPPSASRLIGIKKLKRFYPPGKPNSAPLLHLSARSHILPKDRGGDVPDK